MAADSGLVVISIDHRGDADYILRSADYDTGLTIMEIKLAYKPYALAISPNRDYVAVATKGGTVVCEASTLKIIRLLRTKDTRAVTFTFDGMWLLCGGLDKNLRVYNAAPAQYSENGSHSIDRPVEKLFHRCDKKLEHRGMIVSVSPSPKQLYAITGSLDKTAIVWCIEPKAGSLSVMLSPLSAHMNSINCAIFITDGIVATGSNDNTCRLWNLNTDTDNVELNVFENNDVNAIAVNSDGLVAIGAGKKVYYFQSGHASSTHEIEKSLIAVNEFDGVINSLCFVYPEQSTPKLLVGQRKFDWIEISVNNLSVGKPFVNRTFDVHDSPDGICVLSLTSPSFI